MAMEKDVQLKGDTIIVTMEIPLKGGKIEIKGIPEISAKGLHELPIKKLKSMEGPHILRYEGSYCIVIEFMGRYYQYCL